MVRRLGGETIKRVLWQPVVGRRWRERPKLRWRNKVDRDVTELRFGEENAEDRLK